MIESLTVRGYGPLPLEYLQKLGQFQAGPGARELFLRTRRDAKQDDAAKKLPAASSVKVP